MKTKFVRMPGTKIHINPASVIGFWPDETDTIVYTEQRKIRVPVDVEVVHAALIGPAEPPSEESEAEGAFRPRAHP